MLRQRGFSRDARGGVQGSHAILWLPGKTDRFIVPFALEYFIHKNHGPASSSRRHYKYFLNYVKKLRFSLPRFHGTINTRGRLPPKN
jgi:hypothetical protein